MISCIRARVALSNQAGIGFVMFIGCMVSTPPY
jgi:hypothetical protein